LLPAGKRSHAGFCAPDPDFSHPACEDGDGPQGETETGPAGMRTKPRIAATVFSPPDQKEVLETSCSSQHGLPTSKILSRLPLSSKILFHGAWMAF
jgi:hypothetical protein